MATHTFSTKLSRRKILASGAIVALSTAPLPAAALPTLVVLPDDPGDDADLDAELLGRLALALQRRAEFNAARLEGLHVYRDMVYHPDYPRRSTVAVVTDAIRAKWAEMEERSGYRAAKARRDRAEAAYNAAARAAFTIPPRSLHGLYAKLSFAARASKEADNGNYEYGDNVWLDIAIADAARMAGLDRA